MDNKKIGKLIAELRKKQGLTQQDLGDMVGVGFKAVSKWECGTTLPDITIINEVSKILGITTDELLAGELNEPIEVEENNNEESNNKKRKSKLIITISIITVLLIFITSIIIYQNNNRTYTYNIVSEEESDIYVRGKTYLKNKKTTMSISELEFKDKEFNKSIIENYEYSIILNDKLLFGYGYINSMQALEEPISIEEFAKNFKTDFEVKTNITNNEIIKNNAMIKFKFLTTENVEIIKEIYITYEKIK